MNGSDRLRERAELMMFRSDALAWELTDVLRLAADLGDGLRMLLRVDLQSVPPGDYSAALSNALELLARLDTWGAQ